MNCSNCGKELKEGAKFCGNCGIKAEQKIENVQPKEDISKKQKENKKIIKISLKKTIAIVSIVFLLILISSIVVLLKNKKAHMAIETYDEKYENNIQETEKNEKEIPEEKQVYVSFMDSKGNEEIELREIDREDLIQYMENIYVKTREKGVSVNWFVYESKIVLYYIEYDYKIKGLDTTHSNTYGAIMYSNHFYPSQYTGSILFYKTHVGIWSTANQAFNEYTTLYETSNLKFKPIDIANIRDNRLAQDLKNSIQTLNNTEYFNIRMGVINKSENPWLQEYFDNQNNDVEIEEQQNITSEQDNKPTYNEQNSNNSNYEEEQNNDDYTSSYEKNNNYSNTAEEYSAPTISIRDSHSNLYNQDYGYITIDISNYDYDDEVTVSVNGNQATRVYRTCYSYDYNLTVGENSFDISVTNKYGKTTNKKYSINFEPSQPKVSITKQGNSYGFFDVPESTPEYNKLKNLDIKVTCNGKSGTITYNEYYNVSEQEEEGENTVVFTVTNKYGKTYTTSYTYTK